MLTTLSVSFSKGLRDYYCRDTLTLARITNVQLRTETLIDVSNILKLII